MIDVPRVRQILAQAPQPPGEPIPEGVSEDECDAFEYRTSIRLPDDVRQWLMVANGPCLGPGGLYGIRPQRAHLDIESIFVMYPGWLRRKWVPLAGDGCGNHYIVPTQQEFGRGHPVLFVEASISSEAPLFIVASDINHFLIALLEKEIGIKGWPFNEKYVTSTDPKITHFLSVPMPWADK